MTILKDVLKKDKSTARFKHFQGSYKTSALPGTQTEAVDIRVFEALAFEIEDNGKIFATADSEEMVKSNTARWHNVTDHLNSAANFLKIETLDGVEVNLSLSLWRQV